MDNQHKQITGYRDLSQEEIDAMNKVKELAKQVGEAVENLATVEGIDHRWLSIGKTDCQKGFMALVRSIAKPTTF